MNENYLFFIPFVLWRSYRSSKPSYFPCTYQKDSIGGMTSLQKISSLIMDDEGVVIRELGKLKQLRSLSITNFKGEHGNTLCSSINEMQFLEKLPIDTIDNNEVYVDPGWT